MELDIEKTDPPLRILRKQSDKTVAEILSEGRKITDSFPKSPEALYMIELRGTRNHDIIKAFHDVYGLPLSVVSDAAKKNSPDTNNLCAFS